MSGDPHGPVEHDDVAGGLARRNDGTTGDHHMVGRGGRGPGAEQEVSADSNAAIAARTAWGVDISTLLGARVETSVA